MKKRLISLLVCVAMLASVLPVTTAFAAPAGPASWITVGEKTLNDGQYYVPAEGLVLDEAPDSSHDLAKGYVHYDNGVLTMNNAVIDTSGKNNNAYMSLFTTGDLEIVLVGRNSFAPDLTKVPSDYYSTIYGLTVDGALTITGGSSDSLTVENCDTALEIREQLEVKSTGTGNVTLNVASDYDGIYVGGDVTFDHATVDISGADGVGNDGRVEYPIYSYGDVFIDADSMVTVAEAEEDGIYAVGDVTIAGSLAIGSAAAPVSDDGIDATSIGILDGADVDIYANDNGIEGTRGIWVYGGALDVGMSSSAVNSGGFGYRQTGGAVSLLADVYCVDTPNAAILGGTLDGKLAGSDGRVFYPYDSMVIGRGTRKDSSDISIDPTDRGESYRYNENSRWSTIAIDSIDTPSVTVGGVELVDGQYVTNGSTTVQTGTPAADATGYACFDADTLTLTLNNYANGSTVGSGNAIDIPNSVIIRLVGTSTLTGDVGICGASGAPIIIESGGGKSDALNILAVDGIVAADGGKVSILGGDLTLDGTGTDGIGIGDGSTTIVDGKSSGVNVDINAGSVTISNFGHGIYADTLNVSGGLKISDVNCGVRSRYANFHEGVTEISAKEHGVHVVTATAASAVRAYGDELTITGETAAIYAANLTNVSIDGGRFIMMVSTDIDGTNLREYEFNTSSGVDDPSNYRRFTLGTGLFIGGKTLTDNSYLIKNNAGEWTVCKDAAPKPDDTGYAYYKDGTLTLNGFAYDDALGSRKTPVWAHAYEVSLIYTTCDDLKINLVGSSTLEPASTIPDAGTAEIVNGIAAYGNLTIEGDGTLSIEHGDITYGIYAAGDMVVSSGTVETTGSAYGTNVNGSFTLGAETAAHTTAGVTYTTTGIGSDGIYVDGDFTLNSGILNATSGDGSVDADGVLHVGAAGDDGIRVYGNAVINGGTINSYAVGAANGNTDALSVYGTLTVNGGGLNLYASADGIYTSDDVTVNGGRVDILTAGEQAIDVGGEFRLVDGEITTQSTFDGILANGSVEIYGGTLDVRSENIGAQGAISVAGGDVTFRGREKALSEPIDLSAMVEPKVTASFNYDGSDPETTFDENEDGYLYVAIWSDAAPAPELDRENHIAYIQGYPDGTIGPERYITREETAMIFYRLLTEETRSRYRTTEHPFTDVVEGTWSETAIATLHAAGIVLDSTETTFEPYAYITRSEFAAIAARLDSEPYTGTGGAFRPNDNITRAEAVTLINRVLGRQPETPDDLLAGMQTFPDNMDEDAWYYLAVQEAANGHTYDRRDNGGEKWAELQNGSMPD